MAFLRGCGLVRALNPTDSQIPGGFVLKQINVSLTFSQSQGTKHTTGKWSLPNKVCIVLFGVYLFSLYDHI